MYFKKIKRWKKNLLDGEKMGTLWTKKEMPLMCFFGEFGLKWEIKHF